MVKNRRDGSTPKKVECLRVAPQIAPGDITFRQQPPGEPMTLEKAYELASSRGYRKSKDAFRKSIKTPHGAEQILRLFGIAKGEMHNEYFDHASVTDSSP